MYQRCVTCRGPFVQQERRQIYCSTPCRENPNPAVYRFVASDGRCYVGSTGNYKRKPCINIKRRNQRLLNYSSTWTFEILEELKRGCTTAKLREAEQKHIERLRSWDPQHGFNMRIASHSKASDASRQQAKIERRNIPRIRT